MNSVRIVSTYCLNPSPNDRSLEFDSKGNPIQKIESTEQVGYP